MPATLQPTELARIQSAAQSGEPLEMTRVGDSFVCLVRGKVMFSSGGRESFLELINQAQALWKEARKGK